MKRRDFLQILVAAPAVIALPVLAKSTSNASINWETQVITPCDVITTEPTFYLDGRQLRLDFNKHHIILINGTWDTSSVEIEADRLCNLCGRENTFCSIVG